MDTVKVENITLQEYNALLKASDSIKSENDLLKGKISELERNQQRVKLTLESLENVDPADFYDYDDYESSRITGISTSYENIDAIKDVLAKATDIKSKLEARKLRKELEYSQKVNQEMNRDFMKQNSDWSDKLSEERKKRREEIEEKDKLISGIKSKCDKSIVETLKEISDKTDEYKNEKSKLIERIEELEIDLIEEKQRGFINKIINNLKTKSAVASIIKKKQIRYAIYDKIHQLISNIYNCRYKIDFMKYMIEGELKKS